MHLMESSRRQEFLTWLLLLSLLLSSTALVIQCESRSLRSGHQKSSSESSQMKALNRLDTHHAASDPYYYVGSPLSLPPYADVLGPSSSPQDYPPFCIYPPFTPLPPFTTPTTPLPFLQPPPPPPESTNPPVFTPIPPEYPVPSPPVLVPGPPEVVPSPPEIVPNPPVVFPIPPIGVPGPPEFEPSPPVYVPSPTGFVPSPTGFVPSPPPPLGFVPSPPEFAPGPPIFLPPVVYPAPRAPAAPTVSSRSLWCVAKPTVPDPIIQEAMNYACGSGADCDSIQPTGACYQPDTLISHASFAFNSYWQRTKAAGGTCDFGRTAMLVTKDPSYDGCRFVIY